MFEPDDILNPFYADNDGDWLHDYMEQYNAPSSTDNNNINNDNNVIDLDDNEPECSHNYNHNNTHVRSQRAVAPKRSDNNNDNGNDSDCVEIPISELTKHFEAKHENKCKIKMLTIDETKQLANERAKHKNELAMIREAKRKKYKTIPSNMRFNSFTGEFEQIKTSFDEAIEKEFQDNKYFVPTTQCNNHNYKCAPTPSNPQHNRNHHHSHNHHHKTHSNKDETNSLSDKSHCSFMKFINKKHNKNATHSDYSFSDSEVKNPSSNKQNLPKDNIHIIDMKQMKYDIVKQIYTRTKHCRKDLMIIFKQIKNYVYNKNNFQRHYEHLIQDKTEEQLHQFYSIGTFLYKTLCQQLISTGSKHRSISLTNNSLWRASDVSLILELIQKDDLSKR